MKTFRDSAGLEWCIKIDASGLRRVQDFTGQNLADFLEIGRMASRLRTDDLFVVCAAWALVQPQAAERKIEREAFEASMCGDVIGTAYDAIAAELPDFFRDATTRRIAAAAINRSRTAVVAYQMKLEEDRNKNSISGTSSTSSAESSASTQGGSPSAS